MVPMAGSPTISFGPQYALATTGVPQASDSVSTMPNASSIEGSTVTAAWEYQSGSESRAPGPRRSMAARASGSVTRFSWLSAELPSWSWSHPATPSDPPRTSVASGHSR